MTDLVHHLVPGGPRPVGPFPHAVEANGFVFVTGQMPTDPDHPDAPLVPGIEAQTRRVLDNLRIVLAGVGLTLADVVMARIYLTDFEGDFAAMNEVYESCFEPGRLPARTTVGVTALAVGAVVEIDLVAART